MIEWIVQGEAQNPATEGSASSTNNFGMTSEETVSSDFGNESSSTTVSEIFTSESSFQNSVHVVSPSVSNGGATSQIEQQDGVTSLFSQSASNNSNGVGGFHAGITMSAATNMGFTTHEDSALSADSLGQTSNGTTVTISGITVVSGSSLGSTVTYNGATIGTIVVPSSSVVTGSFSFSSSSTGSSMITESGSTLFDTFDYWQGTVLTTTDFPFNSWTNTTVNASQWTTTTATRTGTTTTAGAEITFSSTYTTVSSQLYVYSSWHGSVTSSSTSNIASVVVTAPFVLGFVDWTVLAPDLCNLLYTAGPVEGVIDFCAAFASVDEATLKPAFQSSTSSTSESESGTSSGITTGTTTGDSFAQASTSQSSAAFASSENVSVIYYEDISYDDADRLQTIAALGAVVMMGFCSGWQPATKMSRTDQLYSSYLIHVVSTVTDSAEMALRSAGQTWKRNSDSQVMTLNSQDTLEMRSLLTGSRYTSTYQGSGGYGGFFQALMSATFSPGVFSVSSYNTDGASGSFTMALNGSQSSEVGEGVQWAISQNSTGVFDSGAEWPDGFNQIDAFEIGC